MQATQLYLLTKIEWPFERSGASLITCMLYDNQEKRELYLSYFGNSILLWCILCSLLNRRLDDSYIGLRFDVVDIRA